MWIYYFVLFLATTCGYLSNLESKNAKNYIFILFTFLILTCFAGFRDASVGTDTNSYVQWFENIVSGQIDITGTEWNLTEEPGYYLVQNMVARYFTDYSALLLTTSGIFVFCVLLAIKKHSLNASLSLFVFICLGYYTFSFNAIRQALAIGIYLLSISYIVNRKFWKYCLVVVIAALFHKSIIVVLPMYFLLKMPFSKKTFGILLCVAALIIVLLPTLLNFGAIIEDRYQLYQDIEAAATGGQLLTLFYAIMAVFFIYERKYVGSQDIVKYDVFLNMSILGSVIYIIVYVTGAYVELTRFAAYFQVSIIFLWPYVFKYLRRQSINLPIRIMFYIGYLGFFYIFINKMADLAVYTINETLWQ